jgi:hypothetical protein
MAANYHHYQMAVHAAAAAAAAAWREPDSPQLSFVSGCSSLFSISTLQDDDGGAVVIAGHAFPSTPVSLAGFAGDEVDMEVQQVSGGSGDDRRSIRMMRNRESALRSRARKRVSTQTIPTYTSRSYLFLLIYKVFSTVAFSHHSNTTLLSSEFLSHYALQHHILSKSSNLSSFLNS